MGVERQEKDCRALADRLGWDVVEVFVDNDTSAYSGKPRPGYERLLDQLGAGTVEAVLAWHPDRLHRSPRELEGFIDLIERTGARVATVQSGEYDLTSPSGRMSARIVGAVARHESEHKSARLRRKHLELAEAGKRSGGGRAYGWNDDDTVNLDEAEVIREGARRVLAGESLRSIVTDWKARGIPTVTGRPWSTTVARRILTAWRTAGIRQHHGEPVSEAAWPAILDRATLERLRGVLLDPSRRVNRSPRRYLLTGLAVCGLCEAKLVARPRQDKRRCYVCASGVGFSGCGKIRIVADPFEDFVAEAVMEALDNPALADAMSYTADTGDDFAAVIGEAEHTLAELAEMFGDGEITRAEWMAARKAPEGRLETARRRLATETRTAALDGLVGSPGVLRRTWPDLVLDRRRAIIVAVLDRVVVGPAVRGRNFFDPDRIELRWRA